jgi:hypothetical protein
MTTPDTAGPPTVEPPYDEYETKQEWHDKVVSWQWKPLGRKTKRKAGECPRCGHPMTIDARAGVIATFLPRRSTRTARPVMARCHCSANHEGHPESVRNDWGCGFRTKVPPPEEP